MLSSMSSDSPVLSYLPLEVVHQLFAVANSPSDSASRLDADMQHILRQDPSVFLDLLQEPG